MDNLIFKASPLTPANRKIATPVKKNINPAQRAAIMKSLGPREIAQPVKKSVSTDLRHAIVVDLEPRKLARPFEKVDRPHLVELAANENKVQADQMQENADMAGAFDEAARAMVEALQESVGSSRSWEEVRRAKHIEELTATLRNIVSMIQRKNEDEKRAYLAKLKAKHISDDIPKPFVDDKLVHLNASLPARAWETRIWQRAYEERHDFDSYVEEVEMEITDLELWETHFDTELDGYDMFRERFFRPFGDEQHKYLRKGLEEVRESDVWKVDTAAPFAFAAGKSQIPPIVASTPSEVDAMDVRLDVPTITFGNAATEAMEMSSKSRR